jgi:hypothetical protein
MADSHMVAPQWQFGRTTFDHQRMFEIAHADPPQSLALAIVPDSLMIVRENRTDKQIVAASRLLNEHVKRAAHLRAARLFSVLSDGQKVSDDRFRYVAKLLVLDFKERRTGFAQNPGHSGRSDLVYSSMTPLIRSPAAS